MVCSMELDTYPSKNLCELNKFCLIAIRTYEDAYVIFSGQ